MSVQPSPYDLLRLALAQQDATNQLLRVVMGMLDKSAPEPLLTFPPPQPEPTLPQAKPERKPRRVEGPAGRPPAVVAIGGVKIETTQRRAKVLTLLQKGPHSLSEMVRLGHAPRNNSMNATILDINVDLERAGSPLRVKPLARPARKTGRGSVAAAYALVDTSKNTAPETIPSAQSEAEARARRDQGSAASAPGAGVESSAHADQFVTLTGEGEGGPAPVDPLPAADDGIQRGAPREDKPELTGECPEASPVEGAPVQPAPAVAESQGTAATIPTLAPAPLPAAEAYPPEAVTPLGLPPADDAIAEGNVAAVDVLRSRVFGPNGDIYVSTRAARALHVLKAGHLLGLNKVAERAKIPSPADCRHVLRIEEAALKSIGLDLYLDKFNARLRRPE